MRGKALCLPLCVVLIPLLLGQGCSSQSYIAATSTETLGDWSPIGSRQVRRLHQFALAPQYKLYVATLPVANLSPELAALNGEAERQLTQELRRRFAQVDSAPASASFQSAQEAAATGNADVLLVPQLHAWPDIDPVRFQSCPNELGEKQLSLKPCESRGAEQQGELQLTVTLYDARTGAVLDAISGRSQRGMAAYLYEDAKGELANLCQIIVARLSPQ